MPVAWWMPVLIATTIVLTGILHYRAVVVARAPARAQGQAETPIAARAIAGTAEALKNTPQRHAVEIFSPFDGSEVSWREVVAGTVNREGTVQVFVVLEDGRVWRQWSPDIRGDRWTAKCQFGLRDTAAARYQIVAVVGAKEVPSGKALPDLPQDGERSPAVNVLRRHDTTQSSLWNGGLLTQLVLTGQNLKLQLENLREASPNDPELLYPLSLHAMPDVIKEPKHKDLWAFRRDYRMHLAQVQRYDKAFASDLALKEFPVNDMKSLDVLRMIESHVNLLISKLTELKTEAGIKS